MKVVTRGEAKAQGLKNYFTGLPCIYGHIDTRRTCDGRCRECDRIRAAKRHAELREDETYKEKNRARAVRWYGNNRDRAMANSKLWVENNKERANQFKKKWADNNKERVSAMGKAWREKAKDQIRERRRAWRSENRAKVCSYTRARQAGLDRATPSWADRDSILVKYKESQRMSALTGVLHHVDHKIPLQHEDVCGLHVAANLRVILARDNMRKSNSFRS